MVELIEYIIGRAGAGKTTYCLEGIRQRLAAGFEAPMQIMLVPEHMTFGMERRLASVMPAGAYMNCQIYGFRRFAQQVLSDTGGNLEPGITELGRQLMLKSILTAEKDNLKYFVKAASKRGFSEAAVQMIDELKSYRITPADLKSVTDNLNEKDSTSNETLLNKLHDLALIYERLQDKMEGCHKKDRSDLLDTLMERMTDAELFKDAEIWLDGFLFLNPQELQLVERLMGLCRGMHISLPMDVNEAGSWKLRENLQETGTFFRAYKTMQRIDAIAERAGAPKPLLRALKKPFRYGRNEGLAAIEGLMSGHRPVAVSNKGEDFRLVETANCRLEAEMAAGDIVRLVRKRGYNWSDIGILIRDQQSYGAMLPVVLENYGIPFYMDSKRSCANHPMAELIRSALRTVVSGWRYDDVFRCFKTGLFSMPQEAIDRLENYVLEFNIKGSDWYPSFDEKGNRLGWSFFRKWSLDDETPDHKVSERLEGLNQIRYRLSEPLLKFHQRLARVKWELVPGEEPPVRAESARDISAAIYQLLENIEVRQRLTEWINEAENRASAGGQNESSKYLAEAKEHQKVWKDIMILLDQMAEICGDEHISVKEYLELLEDGLDSLRMSFIPPGIDYVTVASFEQNSLDNIKAIYVLGANEGVMPKRVKENAILSDTERSAVNAGLKNTGTDKGLMLIGQDAGFNERYLLYRGFTQSSEYLWVSYSLADADGKGLKPSSLVARLRGLKAGEDLFVPVETFDDDNVSINELKLASSRQAVSELANALRFYRDKAAAGRTLSPMWRLLYNWAREQDDLKQAIGMVRSGLFHRFNSDKLSETLAKGLYAPKGIIRGSVSRLEQFNRCPFSYFAKYGLKLEERRIQHFQSMDLGTLIHAVLEKYGMEDLPADASEQERQEAMRKKWDVYDADRCDRLVDKLAKGIHNSMMFSSKKYMAQLKRIKRTMRFTIKRLCDFYQNNSFVQEYAELSFGKKGEYIPSFQLRNGCRLELVGVIDRVDIHDQRFMVIDYKTGSASISMSEVYDGQKLQLLTYMLVAKELLEGKLPAAMMYWFAKRTVISVNTTAELSSQDIQKKIDKELKVNGWLQVLERSDAAVVEKKVVQNILDIDEPGRYTGVEIKAAPPKKGFEEPYKMNKTIRKRLRTDDEFDMLMNYTRHNIKQAGQKILSGSMEAAPYKKGEYSTCTYCPFDAFCCFDKKLAEFEYREAAAGDDEQIAKLMKESLVSNTEEA